MRLQYDVGQTFACLGSPRAVRAANVRNVPGATLAPSRACLAEDNSPKCTKRNAFVALLSNSFWSSRRRRLLVVTLRNLLDKPNFDVRCAISLLPIKMSRAHPLILHIRRDGLPFNTPGIVEGAGLTSSCATTGNTNSCVHPWILVIFTYSHVDHPTTLTWQTGINNCAWRHQSLCPCCTLSETARHKRPCTACTLPLDAGMVGDGIIDSSSSVAVIGTLDGASSIDLLWATFRLNGRTNGSSSVSESIRCNGKLETVQHINWHCCVKGLDGWPHRLAHHGSRNGRSSRLIDDSGWQHQCRARIQTSALRIGSDIPSISKCCSKGLIPRPVPKVTLKKQLACAAGATAVQSICKEDVKATRKRL